ncbi:hypothetical protein [Brazilian marseillevirus]|uniref:hypothetical protein n=1 Tax=Brazilian marseillevirus TaxID=1813599 RepID=UPI0007806E86|nr:hypothetical protein A3303_gp167 [Brazilian marseillevirus]AMQ10675.1 hypothetical protein [Brazilian marseillevirus]
MISSNTVYLVAYPFRGKWIFELSMDDNEHAVCKLMFPILFFVFGISTPESQPSGSLHIAIQSFVDSAKKKMNEAIAEEVETYGKTIKALEQSIEFLRSTNEQESVDMLDRLLDKQSCARYELLTYKKCLQEYKVRDEETPGNVGEWRNLQC